jgi:hypothetical protein
MTERSDPLAEEPAPARWWRQRPSVGIAVSLASGAVAMWIASALRPQSAGPSDTIAYLVSLPIALLLPAAAVAGGLIGWQAWQASRGPARAMLLLPMLAAASANMLAIAMFARVIVGFIAR